MLCTGLSRRTSILRQVGLFLQNRQQLRLELDPFAHCRQQRRVGERFLKIPFKHERADVLRQVHDGQGHFGRDATWARLYNLALALTIASGRRRQGRNLSEHV